MATGMHMDERSVDCLVLGHHDQDRKVSAKSVTIRAMTLCKNLSGYRELLLYSKTLIAQTLIRKRDNLNQNKYGKLCSVFVFALLCIALCPF